ncbi:MAG: hypothetical protein JNK95_07625 [Candidatus Competibacter sp.]|nr:hypothetical protein [Candidatus Competibacter sp.]MDG4606867.1 hypothetical protein [Candidatus Contendobacter sp.]HRD48308.1 hypothetical protein [Candidatus Contendobacter sp.]
MEQLKSQLNQLIQKLPDASAVRNRLTELYSVYPFNEFEYVISTLLGRNILALDEYYEIRDSYMERNSFLYIFEISAPRTFGEAWAQGHLKELVPELSKPSRKLDPSYSGEYDFFLDGKIRIEVKASRAVDAESDEPLYVKALTSDSSRPFWMNFQQVKPACCDVFVWIAVWRNKIHYWVLSSHELEHHRDYSTGQHRGNTGEGQLHVRQDNINDFKPFKAASNHLANAIRGAYAREVVARKQ